MQILINKITGSMAEIPADGNCGTDGNKLLTNTNIETRIIGGYLANHFILGHCAYVDGDIVVIAEDEWPENQIIESVQ